MQNSIIRKALCAAGAMVLLAGSYGCQKNPIEPETEGTNVAEIRSLVLAENPGDNTDTDLSGTLKLPELHRERR